MTEEHELQDAEKVAILEGRIQALSEIRDTQCVHGNWNFDPYMHGLANGLIFAEALMKHNAPEFLEAPAEWICDTDRSSELGEEE